MNLVAACVANPVKVAVGVVLVTMFGILAIVTMPVQLTPEVEVPTISVESRWIGASPQEVERELVQPLEEQLRSVEGLVKLSSDSGDSVGTVDLEFAVGTDMSQALVKVNTRVQQVRDWPIDAYRPVIRTSSVNDRPVAWLILGQAAPDAALVEQAKTDHPALVADLDRVLRARTPDLALFRLRRLVSAHPELARLAPPEFDVEALRRMAEDEIESRLERVDGVSNADLVGGRADELQVIVDPQKLAARQLTIDDLRLALANQNQDTSGGDVWEGKRRYVVRTLGQFRSPEQVEGVIISRRGGKPVYVRDVAQARLGTKKPDGIVRRFGARNIAVRITREQGTNVLEMMRRLRGVAGEIDAELAPRGLALTVVYDETTYIDSAIGLVNDNILVGGALTLGTLLLFLRNIRSTLIVALSIPVSVMGTFLALAAFDRTLNVISLAGIAFAVGMLIDNAVVVLENIFVHWSKGEDPGTAAVRGTTEVWGAILASTLTNVAVFLPVLFVQGEAGQLFGDIALAIAAAVGLSLAVSGLVVPAAAAWLLQGRHARDAVAVVTGAGGETPGASRPAGDIVARFGGAFTAAVIRLDRFLLGGVGRTAVTSLLIVGVAAWATWALMPKAEYLPEGNRNLVFGILLPPPGYNIDELLRLGDIVEKRLLPYWDVDPGTPEAAALDAPILGDLFFVARGRSVFIGVRSLDPLQAAKLVPLIRRIAADLPGTIAVAKQSSLFEQGIGSGRTVDVEITGPDLAKLVQLGLQVMAKLPEATPGSQNLPKPSLDLSSPEIQVVPRLEQAADMQLDARQLGYMVDCLVDGGYATDYFLDNDRIDLVIKGDERFVKRTQDLRSLPVITPGGQLVPLESVAEVREFSSGPEQILHRERERAITVQVSPPARMPLEEAQERITNLVVKPLADSGALVGGYRITLGGTTDKLVATWKSLWFNLVLAAVITYLLMAALFESWAYPAVVMLSVPLGSVGGLLGLALLNRVGAAFGVYQPLDVLTMLGFVILIGTVVNNPILIVERALQLARGEADDGHGPWLSTEAILEAVRSRIRPIFMTTLTTVLGLLPLVLFPGAGSELYRGLGAVLLGGMLISTLVTLVLVPLLLGICFRLFPVSRTAQPRIPGIVAAAWLAVFAANAFGQPVPADVPASVPADRLMLTGVDGSSHGFAELLGADGQAVCFAFLHPACPLAQEYAPVLSKLAADFAGRGIRFVGVVCECDDPAELAAYRKEFGITFPIHLDTGFTLAETLDATTTPEVVLVDRERRIRYAGRIDDRYKIRGVMTPGDAEPELRHALEDLVAGRAIGEPKTKAAGCPLDRPERPVEPGVVAAETPTFHKHVVPFLHTHCQLCHSPGQAGPFNLLTYDDAVEWVELGLEELDARRMPPAQIESDLDYAGPKSPTAAEITMLRAWVAAGKPEGDPADTPALEPLPDYSAFQEDLGPPDIVIDLPQPTQLGAHGNDLYRNLVFPLNRDEDLQLRAFQFLPGNRRVVHHTLIGYLPRHQVDEAVEKFGGREGLEHPDDSGCGFWDIHGVGFRIPPPRDDGQPRSAFIGGFVPGVRATVAPPGASVVIPAGCDLLAQMHYVRTGKAETDASRMGLWLAKEKPSKVMNVIYVPGEFSVVPAGVTDFRVSGSWTIRQDADYVGIVPHAHQLARWLEVRAYPPGAERPLLLLRVPQWDYNWQSAYDLREPKRFPAGTRFEVSCSFDNSAGNPRNPFDPPQNVWHNETIHDEMLLPVLSFTSERMLDGRSESFLTFWASTRRGGFLKRLVEHRYRYVYDADGTVRLADGADDDEAGH